MTKLKSIAKIIKRIILTVLAAVVGLVIVAYLLLLGSGGNIQTRAAATSGSTQTAPSTIL